MKFWDDIIDTAMLGTDKRSGPYELSDDLAAVEAVIAADDKLDKEERFLKLAAVAYNYRQCGLVPVQDEGVTLISAPAEEKVYCNRIANQVLKDILEEDSTVLLKNWLERCAARNEIVNADVLPELLSKGSSVKSLQPLITTCVG